VAEREIPERGKERGREREIERVIGYIYFI